MTNLPAVNPFIYNRPVEPVDLIDRDAEAARLLVLAEGGHATRLSAPRRYGKTSLLGRVMAEARSAGMSTVRVDFFGVVSLEDVVLRIEDGYERGLHGRARRAVGALLRSLRPSARIGVPGASIGVGPRPEADVLRVLTRMLDLPLAVHEKTGQRTLVVFDEFQAVLRARPQIDGLMRSHLQHHGDAASYVYAGSQPSLMQALFSDRERPLYGQARPVALDPLPDDAIAEFVVDRFARAGRDPGDALDPLLELADGHPQRAMLLAHHLWEAAGDRGTADLDTWETARDAVLMELAEPMQIAWSAFPATHQTVLAALADGAGSLYSRATLELYGIRKGSARSAYDHLLQAGEQLHRVGEDVRFVDPLLAEWIRARRRRAD
jgi:uncharacterized protein